MPRVPNIAILSAVAVAATLWSSFLIAEPGMTWLPICGALPTLDEPALAWSLGQWRPSDMAAMWIVMVAAMMPPLIARPLDHVCRLSFAERRGRAVGLFTLAYGAAWVVAGVPLVLLATTAIIAMPGAYSVGTVVTLAALVWQVSPLKQRLLNRCHLQPPLRAFGWSADQDVARFGVEHAISCIGACWPLMLLSQTPGPFHLPVMVSSALFALGERYESPRPPAWGWKGPGTIVRLAVARSRLAIEALLSEILSEARGSGSSSFVEVQTDVNATGSASPMLAETYSPGKATAASRSARSTSGRTGALRESRPRQAASGNTRS